MKMSFSLPIPFDGRDIVIVCIRKHGFVFNSNTTRHYGIFITKT